MSGFHHLVRYLLKTNDFIGAAQLLGRLYTSAVVLVTDNSWGGNWVSDC